MYVRDTGVGPKGEYINITARFFNKVGFIYIFDKFLINFPDSKAGRLRLVAYHSTSCLLTFTGGLRLVTIRGERQFGKTVILSNCLFQILYHRNMWDGP